jgi:protein-tyrosine phosphatase
MIDISCQLLNRGYTESLHMCRRAAQDGVRAIVATPYWKATECEPPMPFAACEKELERLRAALGGTPSLKLGFLMQFGPRLSELAYKYRNRLALGGGRYVLVALSPLSVPKEAVEIWGEMSELNLSVVIARPECSLALRKDASCLDRWVRSGVLLQIDSASVAGTYGREVRQFALHCAEKYGSSVVLASSPSGVSARGTSIAHGYKLLTKCVGRKRARVIVSGTLRAIIDEADAAPGKNTSAKQNCSGVFLPSLRVLDAKAHAADES